MHLEMLQPGGLVSLRVIFLSVADLSLQFTK